MTNENFIQFIFMLGQCFRLEKKDGSDGDYIRCVPGQEYIMFEKAIQLIFSTLSAEQYEEVLTQVCHSKEQPKLPPYRGNVLEWFKSTHETRSPLSIAVLLAALHNACEVIDC